MAVEEEVVAVTIGSSVEARLVDERGQTLGMLPAMQPLTMAAAGSQVQALNVRVGRIRVVPSRPEGLVFIGDRWFRGAAEAFAAEGRLTALNLVDLEAYLYGVVGAEMVASWPEEALKAQAIAARTYALFHWGRRQNQTHDIGDTVQWQVYRGAQYETDSVRRAVEATAGQVITFQGNVINAMYHSHSGGRTEDIKVYGEEDKPYLRTVEDFDQAAPYWKWQQVIPTVNLRKTFGLGRWASCSMSKCSSAAPAAGSWRCSLWAVKAANCSKAPTCASSSACAAISLRSPLWAVRVKDR